MSHMPKYNFLSEGISDVKLKHLLKKLLLFPSVDQAYLHHLGKSCTNVQYIKAKMLYLFFSGL